MSKNEEKKTLSDFLPLILILAAGGAYFLRSQRTPQNQIGETSISPVEMVSSSPQPVSSATPPTPTTSPLALSEDAKKKLEKELGDLDMRCTQGDDNSCTLLTGVARELRVAAGEGRLARPALSRICTIDPGNIEACSELGATMNETESLLKLGGCNNGDTEACILLSGYESEVTKNYGNSGKLLMKACMIGNFRACIVFGKARKASESQVFEQSCNETDGNACGILIGMAQAAKNSQLESKWTARACSLQAPIACGLIGASLDETAVKRAREGCLAGKSMDCAKAIGWSGAHEGKAGVLKWLKVACELKLELACHALEGFQKK